MKKFGGNFEKRRVIFRDYFRKPSRILEDQRSGYYWRVSASQYIIENNPTMYLLFLRTCTTLIIFDVNKNVLMFVRRRILKRFMKPYTKRYLRNSCVKVSRLDSIRKRPCTNKFRYNFSNLFSMSFVVQEFYTFIGTLKT